MRFPVEIVRADPRAGRRRLPDRLPDLAARPGRGRPDLGRGRRARAAAGGRPASPPSTPASAGTRRGCRRSSPRSRAASGRRGPARLRRGGRRPGLRLQPDQHPRAGRASCSPTATADLVSMARPFLADPDFVAQGRRRAAPTRSTPASPATRPASTTPSRTSTASCLVNPRACHETDAGARPRPGGRATVAVVGAGPAGLAAAVSAAERGFAGHPVRGRRRRSAASSGWRWRSPARRTSPRRCATTRAGSRCSASTSGSSTRGDRRRPRGVRRGGGRHRRRPRGSRTSTGIDHPKVVSYADVLGRRGRARPPGRRDRRRRDRRRRQPLAHPRPGRRRVDDWLAHWGVGDPAVHPGGLTEPKPRTPVREVTLVQRKTTPDRHRPRQDVGLGAPGGAASSPASPRSAARRTTGSTTPACTSPSTASPRVLDVDHVVVCAGQESVRGALRRAGRGRRRAAPDRRRRRRRRARRQAGDRPGHPGRGRSVAWAVGVPVRAWRMIRDLTDDEARRALRAQVGQRRPRRAARLGGRDGLRRSRRRSPRRCGGRSPTGVTGYPRRRPTAAALGRRRTPGSRGATSASRSTPSRCCRRST